MEQTESIGSINSQLIDLFGIDTITGQAMFRIVWSEEQFEKRLTQYTDNGLALLIPEVRLLQKYRQLIQNKYVLERLCVVPEINQDELPAEKLSYEPIWVFETKQGDALPPTLWASKFVIDSLYAAMGKHSLRKYVDEEAKNPEEHKEKRLKEYEEQLFGDESSLLGRTITGEVVGYGVKK